MDLADNSTIGAGGLTKITNPRGIEYFDEQLFFFDKNDCQIKVVNLSSSQRTYFGKTVDSNRAQTLIGSSCHKNVTVGSVASVKFKSTVVLV